MKNDEKFISHVSVCVQKNREAFQTNRTKFGEWPWPPMQNDRWPLRRNANIRTARTVTLAFVTFHQNLYASNEIRYIIMERNLAHILLDLSFSNHLSIKRTQFRKIDFSGSVLNCLIRTSTTFSLSLQVIHFLVCCLYASVHLCVGAFAWACAMNQCTYYIVNVCHIHGIVYIQSNANGKISLTLMTDILLLYLWFLSVEYVCALHIVKTFGQQNDNDAHCDYNFRQRTFRTGINKYQKKKIKYFGFFHFHFFRMSLDVSEICMSTHFVKRMPKNKRKKCRMWFLYLMRMIRVEKEKSFRKRTEGNGKSKGKKITDYFFLNWFLGFSDFHLCTTTVGISPWNQFCWHSAESSMA